MLQSVPYQGEKKNTIEHIRESNENQEDKLTMKHHENLGMGSFSFGFHEYFYMTTI